jgi:hypothetical protein
VVDEPIVAVGLLTPGELETLGPTFKRAWPVEDTGCFDQLLRAIDESGIPPRKRTKD